VPRYDYPPTGFRPPVPVGPGGAPLAEPWQRLVAYVVDGLVVGVATLIPMLLVVGLIMAPFFAWLHSGDETNSYRFVLLPLLAVIVAMALQIAASYFYFARMCYKTGQTVGKRVMKIRLVRAADGGPIDLRTAKRRWLVQHLSASVAPYFNLADSVWLLWDQPYRQCLHDKAAETVVVQVTA
jgi:uncharacterized RDD family membrane protein YckC